jgi:hypothetical protein
VASVAEVSGAAAVQGFSGINIRWIIYLSQIGPNLQTFKEPRNKLQGARIFNFLGAQESIPRNQFRQAVYPGGPVRQPYSYSVPGPH